VAEVAQDFSALVRAPIAVGVFEGDEVWWIGDIEAAFMPDQAHGKHQPVCKHPAHLIPAVTIAILQQADPAGVAELLKFRVKIQPRRLRHEQASALVEGAEHGKSDGRFGCNLFNGKAIGDEQVFGFGGVSCRPKPRAERDGQQRGQNKLTERGSGHLVIGWPPL
jgi:hypothetical protein